MLKTNSVALRRFQLMALEHIERRAARMRRRREELGLTQEEVADRMQDIHTERSPDEPRDKTRGQMVSDWERSINEPSPAKLELLASALGWTVGDLNGGAAEKEPTPDLMGTLSPTLEAADLAELHRKLDQVLAGQTELRSEIAQVRLLQGAQQQTQAPAERKREPKRK